MPTKNRPGSKRKPMTRSRRRSKQKKQRRGPVMRFRFGQLILIWIFSLILCFAAYLYNRNFHPEKDVFLKSNDTETVDSAVDSEVESLPDETPDTGEPSADPAASAETPTDVPNEEAAEETPAAPTKINPVPESAPQPPDYLTRCAFLGETNIYNLGKEGMLQTFNVYASENLSLNNYTKEYVQLGEDTTIRILSAINSANCPTYLMFGTETLAKNPPDQSADQFDSLLTSVIATAPEATIFVLSIPPVTEDAEKADPPLLNSDIDSYNSKLLDLCNKYNVYYVDVNTALKNNEGKLDRLLALEDGIHLTPEAGRMLLDYVLTHVPVE